MPIEVLMTDTTSESPISVSSEFCMLKPHRPTFAEREIRSAVLHSEQRRRAQMAAAALLGPAALTLALRRTQRSSSGLKLTKRYNQNWLERCSPAGASSLKTFQNDGENDKVSPQSTESSSCLAPPDLQSYCGCSQHNLQLLLERTDGNGMCRTCFRPLRPALAAACKTFSTAENSLRTGNARPSCTIEMETVAVWQEEIQNLECNEVLGGDIHKDDDHTMCLRSSDEEDNLADENEDVVCLVSSRSSSSSSHLTDTPTRYAVSSSMSFRHPAPPAFLRPSFLAELPSSPRRPRRPRLSMQRATVCQWWLDDFEGLDQENRNQEN